MRLTPGEQPTPKPAQHSAAPQPDQKPYHPAHLSLVAASLADLAVEHMILVKFREKSIFTKDEIMVQRGRDDLACINFIPGFHIDGFSAAFFGVIVLPIVNMVLQSLVKIED